MVSRFAYAALVTATALERLLELAVARRNAAWSFERGGREHGRGHYPFIAALHAGLLGGAVAEVFALERPFLPALGWPTLLLALSAQALRWWCIRTLGPRWNTRVIVVPGLELVTSGPYRWLRHPNYLAVVVEGLALPLVHTAWFTAAAFTALNACALAVRIRCENAALAAASGAGVVGQGGPSLTRSAGIGAMTVAVCGAAEAGPSPPGEGPNAEARARAAGAERQPPAS